MESLLAFDAVHWDHEPTPNPSQEGNGEDAEVRLRPSWEGPGVGRFMERRLGLVTAHSSQQPTLHGLRLGCSAEFS